VNCRPVKLVQETAQTSPPQSCTKLLNSVSTWQLNYEKSSKQHSRDGGDIFFICLLLLFNGLQGFNVKWKIQKFCKFIRSKRYLYNEVLNCLFSCQQREQS